MTTKETLDELAVTETKLFYAHCRVPKYAKLEKAWSAAKASLEVFSENAKAMCEISWEGKLRCKLTIAGVMK